MVEARAKGATYQEIADAAGLSVGRVHILIKREGRKTEGLRKRGRPRVTDKRVGLTLRLDKQLYRELKLFTLEEKARRKDFSLGTHELMVEAISNMLARSQ